LPILADHFDASLTIKYKPNGSVKSRKPTSSDLLAEYENNGFNSGEQTNKIMA
jgi:hypothetical protein